jgi:ATP-dependent Lon protease
MFVLDEIDKLSSSNKGGGIRLQLCGSLDQEQNNSFYDN